MEQTVGKKISKNTVLGILFKVLSMVLALASRAVFVRFLSEEYLGINGLYTNILSVLSMADLGVHAVMIYVLYEPLKHGDHPRLAALVRLFRRIFYGIAAVILLMGCVLIPGLPWLVKGSCLSSAELVKYYLLFLIHTACSYLGTYKSTLLIADQKAYYVNAVQFASNAAKILAQIGVLYLTRNYTLYLYAMIAGTLANNAVLTVLTERMYPQLKAQKETADLSDVKPMLYQRTKSVFLYRIGGTLTDSTDNILISVLIGTVAVGYYSNYNMLATTIFGLLGVLSQACMTGIGSLSVDAGSREKEAAFYKLTDGYFYIGTVLLCGMLCVTNDFIQIWLQKENYILSQGFVTVLAVRLFFDVILSPNWIFRESQGLFDEAKNIRLVASGYNLVLSVILGMLWGMTGIIAATTVSKLLSTFWYEPRVICRAVFGKSVKEYWLHWIRLAGLAACAVVLCCGAAFWLHHRIGSLLLRFLVKGVTAVLLTTGVFAGAYFAKTRKNR